MMTRKRFVARIITACLGVALIASNSVFAVDTDFFSGNDILFYDPTGCTVTNQSGDIALEGNDVAEKIFRFLTTTSFAGFNNKPFNALQAAGALGNFQQESAMDPGAIEGNGEGHGLAQWSYDRRVTLFDLANQMGKKWSDLDVQVKMIDNELNGSYGQNLIHRGFATVSSPKEASYIFQIVYEGAGDPQQQNRDNAAEAYYKEFAHLSPSDTSGTSTSSSSSCTTTASDYTNNDGFVVYNQNDPRWANVAYGPSTIGPSGCGPTAMATIITALTGKAVTPDQTATYGGNHDTYIPGTGSSWLVAPILAKHWGLQAEQIEMNVGAMNMALRNGKLLIVAGRGSTPFTSAGHYIVIRGVNDNGKWAIADSNGQIGQENSKKAWDPQTILVNASAGSLYAISK